MQEVYCIPVLNDFLVYAPLHKLVLLINQAALGDLQRASGAGSENPFHAAFRELKYAAAPPPSIRTGTVDPYFLGIIPTRSCNMSCGYCGFGASSAPERKMDLDTAVACVDWLVDTTMARGNNLLNIHFFGGEPLLAWDVVETVVHRARWLASKYELQTHFEVSTNGLLNEKKARFVGDYFDVVVLSMDGWKPFHDRNRPVNREKGSFDEVAKIAGFWKNFPLSLCLRMCVTEQSVTHLEEIGTWYCEEFQPDVINFDTLQDWPKSLEAGLRKPDPYQFALHFIRARERIEKYGVEAVYAADLPPAPRHSFCPLGKDAVIVTPEGIINGCYLQEEDWKARGMDLRLGYMDAGKKVCIEESALRRLRDLVRVKPDCEECFCKWSCGGGCHVNHSFPGAEMDSDFCIQTRIITACSLLREAGQAELADDLLQHPEALERLAAQPSYHLTEH